MLLAAVLDPNAVAAPSAQWNTTLDTIVLRGIANPSADPMSWLVPQNTVDPAVVLSLTVMCVIRAIESTGNPTVVLSLPMMCVTRGVHCQG